MTYPIDLPDGPHATAFRAFVDFLRDDPDLSRVVKTWQAFAGDRGEDVTPTSPDQLPAVKLTPEAAPARPVAMLGQGRRLWSSPVDVTIETSVAGTRWGDSANLWAAIAAALFPPVAADGVAVRARLVEGGIQAIEQFTPATSANDSGGTFAVAKGTVRLEVRHAG